MNLYEFEGKNLFVKHSIAVPQGIIVRREDRVKEILEKEGFNNIPVVVKSQVLSGKRGKNNGIRFCSSVEAAAQAVSELFLLNIRNQYVTAVRIEEKLDIAEEHYLSITYDTNRKQPVLIYSTAGGMDIEDVPPDKILKVWLDVRSANIQPLSPGFAEATPDKLEFASLNGAKFTGRNEMKTGGERDDLVPSVEIVGIAQKLWECFLTEDCRQVEINPLVKTKDGKWMAADAKIALDDDAFYKHSDWETLEPRTMMGRLPTEREIAVKKIDEGEAYYRGTAGKYIELDGDIALILNGGGASIANMDAILSVGLKPANYTEYSGNPPREKVYQLAKIVLSKPGILGLWMCGVVANFTNVKETFLGIIDALDEIKPTYPIVVRRDGPESAEAMSLMRACAERNNLKVKLLGKETSMGDTAGILAAMVG